MRDHEESEESEETVLREREKGEGRKRDDDKDARKGETTLRWRESPRTVSAWFISATSSPSSCTPDTHSSGDAWREQVGNHGAPEETWRRLS